MEIKSQFTFDQVRFDQDSNIHLVLSLTAPKSDWQAQRKPLCIIPVLDISGSMSGAKLDYAKQSILKLIDHLSPQDYLGLVSFSSSARVDAKPRLMTAEAKDEFRAIVNRYHVEGSTNFSDGMILAFKIANEMDLAEATLVRVIAFTDGQPTHGITDQNSLKTLFEKSMGRTTVSAFGYGVGANQELLGALSAVGKGSYAFIEEPDAALAAFGKELGGLLSTYGQNLRLEIVPTHGHKVTEVLTDVDVSEEITGEVTISMPHILSEETLHLVLATRLAEQKSSLPRPVNVFELKLSYQVVDADGKLVDKTETARARVQFAKPGDEQKKPTKAVDEIVARAQLVKTQAEAEKLAKEGNWAGAQAAFNGFQAEVKTRGHVAVAGVGTHVASYYSPEVYGASLGNRQGIMRAMNIGTRTSRLADADESVLLNAGYQTTSAAQSEMVESFQAEPATPFTAAISATPPVVLPQAMLTPAVNPAGVNLSVEAAVAAAKAQTLSKTRSKRW